LLNGKTADSTRHPSDGAKPVTEKQFQRQVIDLAKLLHYKVYFTWNSFHSPAGFPDLVLTRPADGRLIFAELKASGGTLTDAQREWLDALRVTKAEVYLWRPVDFDRIMEILR
jgi:hypothetical protein